MIRTAARMGTIVTIHVVEPSASQTHAASVDAGIDRALDWFRQVEACCTRFDPASEVMQLTHAIGVATPVSELLFEAVQFALAVAEDSGGAFDPTVGHAMEARGFNEEYQTRTRFHTPIDPAGPVSYRDVSLDRDEHTITLLRPLILDLGAVAKGLAVDLAARELQEFEHYAIDAGGDLYLAGHNPAGEPWAIGIRHPRETDALIDTLMVSDAAVCTSGDYERRSPDGDVSAHILDPRAGAGAASAISVTVVAPTAMLADALGTAAFVLGPIAGLVLLERHGVEGLIVTPALDRYETPGLRGAHGG